ncbi:MAG: YkgJ family cysteine cluster protein [Desulfobulbus sp.]|nr:MAG: YkgJ family cysteine cluster protein [Desulfobulbus sp.]
MNESTLDPALIPEGRTVIGDQPFSFHCHPDVSCYKACCRRLELYLYPYDVLRLKNRLGLPSSRFMHQHTRLGRGSHPYFPAVLLNMAENDEQTCPFLSDQGCTVYSDRPSACRTYPLERAVEKTGTGSDLSAYYFMTHHAYCRGHFEDRQYTLRQWERDQVLYEYNRMNDLWAEVDAFFATNPWQGEGVAGPLQQLAFMVCYNLDEFRAYVARYDLLRRSRLDKERRRRVERDDAELLKFGFSWLLSELGSGSLR